MCSITDIDECETGTHACNHICMNTVGSYNCSCNNAGYVLDDDGHTCIGKVYSYIHHQHVIVVTVYTNPDVDECQDVDVAEMCHQRSVNTEGSYGCGCYDGYRLTSDSVTCEGTTERCLINCLGIP